MSRPFFVLRLGPSVTAVVGKIAKTTWRMVQFLEENSIYAKHLGHVHELRKPTFRRNVPFRVNYAWNLWMFQMSMIRWHRYRSRARRKQNGSQANKRYLVRDSFQLLFLLYQPWILFRGLLPRIKVGFFWSIPCGDALEYAYSWDWKRKSSGFQAKE